MLRRTRAFPPLCLIGRYGLPVFATGTVLSAVGEVVETRSEAFSHQLAFGTTIVVGGILMHYLVARGLAAWRDKSRAQQRMMEPGARLTSGFAIVLADVSNRLVVGNKPAHQPHRPEHIWSGLALESGR
jgi:hypothetical protein